MCAKPKVNVSVPILEADLRAQIEAVAEAHYLDWSISRADLLAAMGDVEGVLVTPRVRGDAEFFAASPKLRVLATTSVGYDAFDIDAATNHGVVVCNTPGVLTNAVANLTVALILNLALKLRENEAYVRDGNWAANATRPGLGIDIQGKTLGVVGFGRIGQTVTRFVQALGMKTIWYDVFDTPHPSAPKSEYRPFDALLAESDFVTLHTNLDANSRHLIGAAELAKMKRTAYLVNTARGGLVDQVALTEALRNGVIAGAGLDVLESEPPAADDPIYKLPNVVCYPHIGSATHETRRAMRELAVQNLVAVLTGQRPPAPVNPEALK
jgi:lactate dehydrogenase-like 2-hydroxyacid dehydrogenase